MFRFSHSKCLPLNLFNFPTEFLISVYACLTALLHSFIFISIFKTVLGEGKISIYVPLTDKELHLRAMRQCAQDSVVCVELEQRSPEAATNALRSPSTRLDLLAQGTDKALP